MINSTRLSAKLIAGAIAASGMVAMSVPALAHAATFAYVNSSSEVRTVVADTWMIALNTAPNIDVHSGVLLLTSQNSGIVGTSF